jgi:cytochrome c-type biogenesis protein CcmH
MTLWLYNIFSSWDWDQPVMPARTNQASNAGDDQHMAEMDRLVAQLEGRLEAGEGSAEDWSLLGRTYANMGQNQKAMQAFEKAMSIGGDQDAKVLLQYGETLVQLDQESLRGKAGILFEKAVQLQPNDPASLWWSGFAALADNRLEVAKQRWTLLLGMNPPENVIGILQEQISAIDAKLGSDSVGLPVSAPAQEPVQAEAPVDGIRLAVSLDEAVANRPGVGQAVLFIIARQPGVMGPPVAVIRRGAAELPLSLVLTDANAMMQGTELSNFAELELVARVSLSGQPTAAPGDLFGSTMYRSGDTGIMQLVINSVVQ